MGIFHFGPHGTRSISNEFVKIDQSDLEIGNIIGT
jgi:hypothetical protein